MRMLRIGKGIEKFRKKKRRRFLRPRYANKDNDYHKQVNNLKATIPDWETIFCVNEDDRMTQSIRVEVLGEPLTTKYAWAIPNQRAIDILSTFSPLIEIGCGNGYWAHLLRERGVDILAYDKFVKKTQCWTTVLKGGPEVLLQRTDNRTLFLCYPDEQEALAIECLQRYSGEYVIHVGELVSTGTYSRPQAPWGRTTAADFQVALHEDFHCLLVAKLPHFPFSRDCISVWKRTNWVLGKEALEQGAIDEEDVEATMWASIPADERLPYDVAAPCLQHLLTQKKSRRPLRQKRSK